VLPANASAANPAAAPISRFIGEVSLSDVGVHPRVMSWDALRQS
jgi:hypothetical protein